MLSEICKALLEAVTAMGTGIAKCMVSVFNEMFIVTSESGAKTLTDLAYWGLAFMGIGLVSTVTWAIFRKI